MNDMLVIGEDATRRFWGVRILEERNRLNAERKGRVTWWKRRDSRRNERSWAEKVLISMVSHC